MWICLWTKNESEYFVRIAKFVFSDFINDVDISVGNLFVDNAIDKHTNKGFENLPFAEFLN